METGKARVGKTVKQAPDFTDLETWRPGGWRASCDGWYTG
jgi:hypothetical protein